MHFYFLHNSRPTVSIYADGRELLVSGAFLTSGSVPKNFEIVSVSGIIEETGVFSWKIGEKMHGMSQS